jgi:phospholipase C
VGLVALAAGCGFDAQPYCAGRTPSAGDASSSLRGIDTIVAVMMENRSFDHFFGALRLDPHYPAAAVVDGLRGDESNPDDTGHAVNVFHQSALEQDSPPHVWDAAHEQFDNGRNDGFVRTGGTAVMGYYTRDDLPFYYGLADRFTVCDRWFSSVMGPTWPNRFYLHCATARGIRGNQPFLDGGPTTIWERLAVACHSYRNYVAGAFPWYTSAFPGKALSGNDPLTPVKIEAFFRDARDGALPAFALIDPAFHINDDHAPASPALGQAFAASIYNALAASPQWPRCLLVITYDEHGGFFDHVAPPSTLDDLPDFRQLGFRVPTLVVGPTVRRGAVDSTVREHVSIARTLATRFGIASLNARMDAAADLSSCIDPALAAGPPPPAPVLAPVELSARTLRALAADAAVADRLAIWLRHARDLDAVRIRD